VYAEAVVKHEGKELPVKLLVDPGATYTMLRKSMGGAGL